MQASGLDDTGAPGVAHADALTGAQSFATLWEVIADAVGDGVVLVQGDRRRTWAEFERRGAELAAVLAARGVGPGTRVAIDLYNSIEFLEVFFAATKLRAVPVNVNYRYKEAELRHLLDDSGARALVFHASLAGVVAGAVAGAEAETLLCVADGSGGSCPGALDYEAVVAECPPAPRIERSGDDELISYTGGTTGRPKGVVWRHASLFGNLSEHYVTAGVPIPRTLGELARVVRQLRAADPPPTALATPPLMHTTALLKAMGTLLLGGKVVLTSSRSLDAGEVWRLVERERVGDLSIVGDVFARPLLAELERTEAEGRPYRIDSLRRISSAGVTWSAEVKRALLRRGSFTLVDALASTEGGPYAVSQVGPDDDPETARFTLAARARVIDEHGRDVAPGSGETGFLAASGNLPVGYLGDAERSARTWREIDGVRYAVPGDLATVELDGSIRLLGRGSEVVNTGGEKVFVEEVEQAVATLPAVSDVLVVGVPDERFGERVCAVVALAPGAELTEDELAAHVGLTLAGYKRPRQVAFVAEIARTATGKADRAWARAVLAGPTPGEVAG